MNFVLISKPWAFPNNVGALLPHSPGDGHSRPPPHSVPPQPHGVGVSGDPPVTPSAALCTPSSWHEACFSLLACPSGRGAAPRSRRETRPTLAVEAEVRRMCPLAGTEGRTPGCPSPHLLSCLLGHSSVAPPTLTRTEAHEDTGGSGGPHRWTQCVCVCVGGGWFPEQTRV